MSRSLRRDDPELRQVTAQRVDRLRAEQHPPGLLLRRLHRYEVHGRALRRLADRLRGCRFTNGFT